VVVSPGVRLHSRRRIELVGHRGARGLYPENTLAGFSAAFALGIDAIELDIAMTADGVPVASHEPTLAADIARRPDGHWLTPPGPLLRTLRFSELRAYDVGRLRPGSAEAARFPAQCPQDGERIPSLAEVISILPGHLLAELKTFPDRPGSTAPAEEMGEATLAVADRLGAASRVRVQSFDWRGPRHLRRIRPEIRLAWLTRADTVASAPLWWGGPAPGDFGGSVPRAVAAEGGPTWTPDHVGLTRDQIAEAHGLGLSVIGWTVNHPGDIARLIDWGIDGLITDRPDLARAVMRRKGLPLPPPLRPVTPPVR
jgi:glycerophosphoryl diester phosphodiesterase